MKNTTVKEKVLVNPMFQFLPTSKDRCDVVKVLSKVAGINYPGGYQGTVALGGTEAELSLGADGDIRLRADAALPPSPASALEATGQFPGNIRYARGRWGGALVADTLVDGQAHLPHTLELIRRAMMSALQSEVHPEDFPTPLPVDREVVRKALTSLPWAKDGVVEQDDGWELRPRLRGEAVPVTMTIEPEGVRLSRTVLRQLPETGTPGALAVADQVLQANARLRHARLAVEDGRLVAEARLDPRLIQPEWIGPTAYAVAVAVRHAGTSLRLLAQQPAIAGTYMMFCSNGEQPTPQGVGG